MSFRGTRTKPCSGERTTSSFYGLDARHYRFREKNRCVLPRPKLQSRYRYIISACRSTWSPCANTKQNVWIKLKKNLIHVQLTWNCTLFINISRKTKVVQLLANRLFCNCNKLWPRRKKGNSSSVCVCVKDGESPFALRRHIIIVVFGMLIFNSFLPVVIKRSNFYLTL